MRSVTKGVRTACSLMSGGCKKAGSRKERGEAVQLPFFFIFGPLTVDSRSAGTWWGNALSEMS